MSGESARVWRAGTRSELPRSRRSSRAESWTSSLKRERPSYLSSTWPAMFSKSSLLKSAPASVTLSITLDPFRVKVPVRGESSLPQTNRKRTGLKVSERCIPSESVGLDMAIGQTHEYQ